MDGVFLCSAAGAMQSIDFSASEDPQTLTIYDRHQQQPIDNTHPSPFPSGRLPSGRLPSGLHHAEEQIASRRQKNS